MNNDTGGPAFPIVTATSAFSKGMTLRDYFAAKAMQGFCTILKQNSGEPFWNVIAEDSYKLADAMLSSRGTEKA